MDFYDFDLNLLVALDALLTEKHVTRAGQRIHLSQSAMSAILSRLRRYFHNELLIPVGRGMMLTPLAESLAQPVRSCLLQIQQTIASRMEFNPATLKRKFSLAVSSYIVAALLPQVVQEATRQAPGVTFELVSLVEPMENQFLNGEIDFIIRPTAYALPSHPTEVLFKDTYTCMAWAENSLLGKTMSRKQYFDLGHVAIRIGGRMEDWLEPRYVQIRKVELIVPTFEAAARLVVGTNRISTLLTRMAVLYAEHMPIKLYPPPIEIPPIVEAVQWHRFQDTDPGHIWLRGLLKQAADNVDQLSRTDASISGRKISS